MYYVFLFIRYLILLGIVAEAQHGIKSFLVAIHYRLLRKVEVIAPFLLQSWIRLLVVDQTL